MLQETNFLDKRAECDKSLKGKRFKNSDKLKDFDEHG